MPKQIARKGFTPGKHGAFTLIELLVVIAIIALLAAILFPTFARAREKARETTCVSNLRQIGLATRMYVQDFDETFPIFHAYNFKAPGMPGPGEAGHKGVEDELLAYSKAKQIFRCPNDNGGPIQTDQAPGTDNYHDAYGSSYRFMASCFTLVEGADGSYQGNAPVDTSGPPYGYTPRVVADADFAFPSETRLMRDEMLPWFANDRDPNGATYGYAPAYYRAWHPNGGGLVYADGHAKFTASEAAFQRSRATPEGKTFLDGCWYGCE